MFDLDTWTPLPADERREATESGMRLVLVTDKELGGWEDAYCPAQVEIWEKGQRAVLTAEREWAILAGYR